MLQIFNLCIRVYIKDDGTKGNYFTHAHETELLQFSSPGTLVLLITRQSGNENELLKSNRGTDVSHLTHLCEGGSTLAV